MIKKVKKIIGWTLLSAVIIAEIGMFIHEGLFVFLGFIGMIVIFSLFAALIIWLIKD